MCLHFIGSNVGQDGVEDQELRIARFHRGTEMRKNAEVEGIVPVVQNVIEEVHAHSTTHLWLRCEEVLWNLPNAGVER
jgi:hypothetical protein